eukprot:comp19400_c0_seq2/m.22454 comp19400_c0_seq2/g.22454  ORF comp19400_c0_seq2/g.22454 comp19400_c0_seq2/m.22454 type:complete len:410 (-) comp19400_c0_seq2:96-1325(-)
MDKKTADKPVQDPTPEGVDDENVSQVPEEKGETESPHTVKKRISLEAVVEKIRPVNSKLVDVLSDVKLPKLPSRPEWVAPLDTPLERRLQTLGVLMFMSLQIGAILLNIYCLFSPKIWIIYLPYLLWILLFDSRSPKNGVGRRFDFIRRMKTWRYFAQYFPVSLHKTVDLDPKKHYLLAYHPHGIIGVGAVASFGTAACGVDELFPGLTIYPATLSVNFKVPFYREMLMALGFCDVGHTSVNNTLRSPHPGNSILIVVGGAAEALDAHPGTNALTLNKRKGFVKFAMKNGASLVPVFGFGENNLWHQVPNPPGSAVRDFQLKMTKYLGFTTPLLFGRGIFQYRWGLVPHRRPVNVVVGRPIDCGEPNPNPTQAEIDAMHEKYVKALQELYYENCDKYDSDRKRDLEIVA